MPVEATERSDAGAAAFTRFYFEVVNHAQMSGETDQLADLSTAECAACQAYVDTVRDTYGSGGRIDGGRITLGRLRTLPADYGADWGSYAPSRATPQTIRDGDGSEQSFEGGRFRLFAYTAWRDGRWLMHWIRTPA